MNTTEINQQVQSEIEEAVREIKNMDFGSYQINFEIHGSRISLITSSRTNKKKPQER